MLSLREASGEGTDVAVGDRIVAAVVDFGLRGCVPLSQLASVGKLGPIERAAVPDAVRDYVGKGLPLKVIEADRRRDRLILSEKSAAQQLRRRRRKRRRLSSGKDRFWTAPSRRIPGPA